MSLRLKLVVIIVFVALVPLAISAFSTLGIHQQAFDSKVVEIHRMSAKASAAIVGAHLENYRKTLKQAIGSIRWADLTEQERDGALWLVYRQLDEIIVTALLDENGDGLGPSVYLDSSTSAEELTDHPLATLPLLKNFATKIPFKEALNNRVATGEIFLSEQDATAIVPLAISVPGLGENARWVVAVGISLKQVCSEVESMSSKGATVYLVNPDNRVVCGSSEAAPLSPINAVLVDYTSGSELSDLRYKNEKAKEVLATVAPLPSGYAIVAEQSSSLAFASSTKMRFQTIFWLVLSVVVAATTGLLLARSISEPVKQLVTGAKELTKGNFNYRLKASSGDELAELSLAFNKMSEEIERRDKEIRQWNEELQKRVDEQTLEIKEIQDQLLHSQKIAAVVSLGAGIAHEINNPLASVLGFTQLMISNANKEPALEKYKDTFKMMEKQSLRIKEIVATFFRFSENYKGEDYIAVNLADLIDSVLSSFESDFNEKGIEVKKEYASELRKLFGDPAKLRQAFFEIIRNSVTAMPDGGQLSLTISVVEDRVVKTMVEDTGKGIKEENLDQIFEPFFTTKEEWSGEGLGLTLVFRVIEEHRGKIKAESKLGEGTTMTIFLPASKGGAHLE